MEKNKKNFNKMSKEDIEKEIALSKAIAQKKKNKDLVARYKNLRENLGATDEEIREAEEKLKLAEKENPSEPLSLAENENKRGPREDVEDFVQKFNLRSRLPEAFHKLNPAQQLYVVENLKKRIVNIVKTDGEIQYSKHLKEKVAQSISPKNKIWEIVKNMGNSIKKGASKEFELKKEEDIIFKELIADDASNKLLEKDLQYLSEKAKGLGVYIEKGKALINYITAEEVEGWSPEEKNIADAFNEAANKFKNIPADWAYEGKNIRGIKNEKTKEEKEAERENGKVQPTTYREGKDASSSNRKIYEKAKKEYENARLALLKLKSEKEKPGEQGKAILDIGKINNDIKLDQLLYANPEYESALNDIVKTPGFNEYVKTAQNVRTLITGKSWKEFGIRAAGYIIRLGTKGVIAVTATTATMGGAITLIAAPIIGAGLGTWKGFMDGKKDLVTGKKGVRYGDEKKGSTGKLAGEIGSIKNELALEKAKEEKDRDQGKIKQLTDRINSLTAQYNRITLENNKSGNFVDITRLTKRLESATTNIEATANAIEQIKLELINNPDLTQQDILQKELQVKENQHSKELALLGILIEHSKNKIELGQVYYGEVKNLTVNNFNFSDALTQAIVLNESTKATVNKGVEDGIKKLILASKENIANQTYTSQDLYIKQKMIRGAKLGARSALFGYSVRWLQEHFGIFGAHHPGSTSMATEIHNGPETPGVMDRGMKWLHDATQWINDKLHGAGKAIEGKWHENEMHKMLPKDPTNHNLDNTTNQETTTNAEASNSAGDDFKNFKPLPGGDIASAHTPAELKALLTAEKIAEVRNNAFESMRNADHGAKVNFEVTLGKDGVPPHLETAFNEISADHLDLPSDGIVNDEMATKSLNMAANMVKLSEGHSIGDIKADEFAKAVTYDKESGVLKVIDHDKFNQIVNDLKERANDSWSNGTLQKEGGAIDQIAHIKKASWVDIMHAKGLAKTPEGGFEGIEGHPAVTAEKVADFHGHPDNQAITANEAGTKGVIEQTQSAPTAEDGLTDMKNSINQLNDNIPLTGPAPTSEEFINTGNNAIDPDGIPRTESAPGGPNNSTDETQAPYADYSASTETLSEQAKIVQIDQIYTQDIARLFRGNSEAWENIRDSFTAPQLLETAREQNILEPYRPLVSFMRKLQEVTGLSPKKESIWRSSDETISGFIKRALAHAQENKTLDRLRIE